MSYAADHLAWKQRVDKEVGKAKRFEDNYMPIYDDADSPLKNLVDKYGSPYSYADPNGIAKYDLKSTVNQMEMTTKDKAKRFVNYRNSITNLGTSSSSQNNFQSTYKMMNSPLKGSISNSARKLQGNKSNKGIHELLAKSNSKDIFTTDRYPRPKPFFHQAYLAKSKVETLSQKSKMGRSKSIGKFKAHYPPGHPELSGSSTLPKLKTNRFNEDTMSEYSMCSKKSKIGKLKSHKKLGLAGSKPFMPQALSGNKPVKVDGTHLEKVPDRAGDLKQMLIDTIEHMNEDEVEVMKSAIDSVKSGNRSRHNKPKLKNHLSKPIQKPPALNEIKEETPDKNGEIKEEAEVQEELVDKVEDLPLEKSPEVKAAVPSTKSKRSMRSSTSTQYISQLQSQIDDERKEREKLQKEIEEMKKISSELLSQLKGSNTKSQQD